MDDATGTVRTPVPGQRPERKRSVPEGETEGDAADTDRSATAPDTSGDETDKSSGTGMGETSGSEAGADGTEPGTGTGSGAWAGGESSRTGAGVEAPRSGTDAAGSSSGRKRRREAVTRPLPVVGITLAVAVVLHLLWLWFLASGGGDLAAQDAWAEFAGEHPGSAYNLAWYGGLHPFSYSVISPYLMAVIGVRTTLMVSGVLSAGLLSLLLARTVPRPLVPSLWGAFAFACNAASGRVTFALGVLFGLGAVAVVWTWPARWRGGRASRLARYTRAALAVLLAALATAASPVAGLFLEVVAASLLLARRPAAMFAVALPPPAVVACSALLFPFTGVQPMPFVSLIFPVLGAVAVVLLVPRTWTAVRVGGAIYTLGIVLTWAIPSQVGSNVERLGLLFGGVALLAAVPIVVGRGWQPWKSRRGLAMALALLVTFGWQIGKPTWDVLHTTPDTDWSRELKPLLTQLRKADADRARVEVVPVNSHREASALAPYVNLARGWNRQADLERNPLFYEEDLSPERYHAWLRRWAVHYVVLPADPPDIAGGVAEAKLVGEGQPYLKEIWSDDSWRLFRVKDPVPLVDASASVERADAESVTVRVRESGRVLVRVPYSPWLGLVDADGDRVAPPSHDGENLNGCLRKAEPTFGGPPPEGRDKPVLDTWTVLDAPRPGVYRIAAPYKLPRGTPCPGNEDGGDSDD
ncbi:MFS transporter [Streptomyces sp. WMMB303]|uniref:MFS transporter n=1 Tax=Streptomyces sp. WMMB303 TaxID=3034154 RepID=UPI0023EE2064|nr:MFS transporter [Streptomyces sp. WMMB303]MDF4251247.1 MFS transporter [Streptomyces sp. WMMB303]